METNGYLFFKIGWHMPTDTPSTWDKIWREVCRASVTMFSLLLNSRVFFFGIPLPFLFEHTCFVNTSQNSTMEKFILNNLQQHRLQWSRRNRIFPFSFNFLSNFEVEFNSKSLSHVRKNHLYNLLIILIQQQPKMLKWQFTWKIVKHELRITFRHEISTFKIP